MKTFKTRSSVMRRVNESTTNSSSTVSMSSPIILFLDIITYGCIEDTIDGYSTMCRYTASAAYFSYPSQNIDILFDKNAFPSDFDNYKNVIAIFILDKPFTVKYKEIISNIYIKYTIDQSKDDVLEYLDKIRETNKQVVVAKNITTQGDRGYYQIFTDKGKVRISK